MSQDNWNIGDWFQQAFDALRGQPAPEEPPYIPPDSYPDVAPPEPEPWSIPFLSGLGDFAGYVWQGVTAPWQEQEQAGPEPAEVASAWDTANKAGTDYLSRIGGSFDTGDVFPTFFDEQTRAAWLNSAGATAEALCKTWWQKREEEVPVLSGAMRVAESVGGGIGAGVADPVN